MAFKLKSGNIGNLFKNVKSKFQKLDSTLQNLGNKKGNTTTTPSGSGNIKKEIDWKYGHGEFKSKEKRRKPGESKFDYDVRMKKSESRAKRTTHDPDKDEIPTGIDATPYGDIPEEQQMVSTNPNDLREQSTDIGGLLPSEPGDPYSYKKLDAGGFAFKLADGDWQVAEGEGLKAIEKRYKDIDIEEKDIKTKRY